MHNKNQKLHNVLLEIVEKKKQDLSLRHPEFISGSLLKKMPKQVRHDTKFREAIIGAKEIALIAEIKLASPTEQHLGKETDRLKRAMVYEEAGADAISIITEPHFFKGDVSFVLQVKTHVKIPVLQKDFVIDAYQIREAKEIGSDALLLIARLVDTKTLKCFVELCFAEGIEPVVEINNEEDLEKALATTTQIIAVNARNLETFAVDIERACLLMKKISHKFILLGFSGINTSRDVLHYKKAGAKGVLVGTSVMKAKNTDAFIKSLRV